MDKRSDSTTSPYHYRRPRRLTDWKELIRKITQPPSSAIWKIAQCIFATGRFRSPGTEQGQSAGRMHQCSLRRIHYRAMVLLSYVLTKGILGKLVRYMGTSTPHDRKQLTPVSQCNSSILPWISRSTRCILLMVCGAGMPVIILSSLFDEVDSRADSLLKPSNMVTREYSKEFGIFNKDLDKSKCSISRASFDHGNRE